MKKNKILVISPRGSAYSELSRPNVRDDIDVVFQPYQNDYFDRLLAQGHQPDYELQNPAEHYQALLKLCEEEQVTGVFSPDDYPGCFFTGMVAQEKQFIGPQVAALLHCSHKFLSRCAQQKSVPEATPQFEYIPLDWNGVLQKLSFPLFAKPIKSLFSLQANMLHSAENLFHELNNFQIPDVYLYQFRWFLRNYGAIEYDDARGFIAEEILKGLQVTVEGCSYRGAVTIFGVVDSIMYPGSISFERFAYPSALPESVQKRMVAIATQAVHGLYLDNTLFNIEMMYNPDTDYIGIIEINPRMASEFGDLYEKVDGINSYTCALRIAADQPPAFTPRAGLHKVAASFVMRRFQDAMVKQVPTRDEIAALVQEIPDIRIHIGVQQGQRLSANLQDGHSFRYMLLHLGGRDEQELNEKKEYCLKRLKFIFG